MSIHSTDCNYEEVAVELSTVANFKRFNELILRDTNRTLPILNKLVVKSETSLSGLEYASFYGYCLHSSFIVQVLLYSLLFHKFSTPVGVLTIIRVMLVSLYPNVIIHNIRRSLGN